MKKTAVFYIVLLLFSSIYICLNALAQGKAGNSKSDKSIDIKALSALNAQFIRNFIKQDTAAHNQIIYKDFICIENDGDIQQRDAYMKAWAHDYAASHLTSFSYTDEVIRIFGNTALVRSKTVYTKNVNGAVTHGNSVYTDTYIKEHGRWWCVQAQITPVR